MAILDGEHGELFAMYTSTAVIAPAAARQAGKPGDLDPEGSLVATLGAAQADAHVCDGEANSVTQLPACLPLCRCVGRTRECSFLSLQNIMRSPAVLLPLSTWACF